MVKGDVSGSGGDAAVSDKKGHVCPPSDAIHPRDRWESLFVYAFICKFTTLRGKVEGFHNALECVARVPSGVYSRVEKL